MTVISDAELTAMREVADDFLPDTCTMQSKTDSVDATGGITMTWADTYEDVACRIDPMKSGDEAVANFATEGHSAWWGNFAYDQSGIDIKNRVVHSNVTYEIKAVHDTQSYSTIKRAVLVRVN